MRKGMVAGATLALCAALTVPIGFAQPARADDWGGDTSSWQGCSFNPAGFDDFVLVRVGGSDTSRPFVDRCWKAVAQRARALGKRVGYYWFGGWTSGSSDADRLISATAGFRRAGEPMAYDSEAQWTSPAKSASFTVRIRSRLGSGGNPLIYTSQGNLAAYNWQAAVSAGARLWVARYGANSGRPPASGAGAIHWWPGWTIWQFSSNGTISTYSGRLDSDTARSGAWGAGTSVSTPIYDRLTAVNQWGYRITQIQRLLNAKINAGLVIDGVQGPKTTAAVKAFQRRTGHLTVDGIIGPQTWRSLNNNVSSSLAVDGVLGRLSVTRLQQVLGTTRDGVLSSQSSWSRSHWTTTVRTTAGARGSTAVRALQRRLHVTVDGQLGPVTIRAWQRHLGVRADGWLGPQTARAIQRALNKGGI